MVRLNHQGLIRWSILLLMMLCCIILINQYGIALSVVNGSSMQPTLHSGDRLLINKFQFLIEAPQRGEVITFQDPSDPARYLVKRVVGVPGDRIEIRNHVLYRNGQKVSEQYVDTSIEDGDFGPEAVKPGTVFVMGDNRHEGASRDSRYGSVGLVPYSLLDGKVEFILWRPSLEASF